MILIVILSGMCTLAGIGGGTLILPILVSFFNYSQKKAALFIFIPVFGAAFGNFLNLAR